MYAAWWSALNILQLITAASICVRKSGYVELLALEGNDIGIPSQ